MSMRPLTITLAFAAALVGCGKSGDHPAPKATTAPAKSVRTALVYARDMKCADGLVAEYRRQESLRRPLEKRTLRYIQVLVEAQREAHYYVHMWREPVFNGFKAMRELAEAFDAKYGPFACPLRGTNEVLSSEKLNATFEALKPYMIKEFGKLPESSYTK